MDQAYPDISPAVKERLHSQGLKPFKLEPLSDFYNPHSQLYWQYNGILTFSALIGRALATKNQSIRLIWSCVIVTIPLLAVGANVKLEGTQANGGHRRTLEEKLDYSPITRRAWNRAVHENRLYQQSIEDQIIDIEYQLYKKNNNL